MTNTMTLKAPPHDFNPLQATNIVPSIPAFMENSFGACSIAVRNKRSPIVREQWVRHNAYVDSQQGATPMEVDQYMLATGQHPLNEWPEPIHTADASAWGSLGFDDGDPFLIDPDFDDLIAAA